MENGEAMTDAVHDNGDQNGLIAGGPEQQGKCH